MKNLNKIFIGIVITVFLINLLFANLWTGSDAPIFYYPFDETTGTNTADSMNGAHNGTWSGAPTWQLGKVNYSAHSEGTKYIDTNYQPFGYNQNFSISLWYRGQTGATGYLMGDIAAATASAGFRMELDVNRLQFATIKDTGGTTVASNAKFTDVLANNGGWIHLVLIYNGTGGWNLWANNSLSSITINGDMAGTPLTDLYIFSQLAGDTPMSNASIDEFGIWNRTLTPLEIEGLYNLGSGLTFGEEYYRVKLNSPANNSNTIKGRTNYFNCSATFPSNIQNISLYTNSTGSFILNQTIDVSGDASTTTTQVFPLSLHNINNTWTCYACSLSNGCDFGENRTISVVRLLENSQTYNPTSSSSKSETFIINFTYDSSEYTSASGSLVYNGTSYTGTLSTGENKLLTATLITPSSTETNVYGFYWNISLTNSSGVNYFTSNNYTQTVSPLSLNRCNNIYNVTFINFTVKNTETLTVIPSSFKITFNYGISNKNLNYSYQDTTQTNSSFPFCFLPSNSEYIADANIEYEATDYSKNYYYLTNAELSNATNNITLFLLNSTKATLTVLKAQTDTQTAISDAYIQIQRYDTGTDTYYTVGMARTDYKGEDAVYLNWYDTFYKYVLTKDGSVIYIANPSKISSTPVTFTIPSSTTFDYDKFLGITYTLTFNNATNNFVLTYSLPSGSVTSACLRVDKRTIKNDTLICNTCETSSSATVYCDVSSYGNGTYIATFYAKGSLGFIDSITAFVGSANKLYDLIGNVDGTMYAILFSALVMVLFFVSPVLGVVGMLLGMIGAMALGFQPVNYMEFLGIVIVGGVIIVILKR